MFSFLGMISTVLVTALILLGFAALGAVMLFEYGALIMMWIKHSLKDSEGEQIVLQQTGSFKRR